MNLARRLTPAIFRSVRRRQLVLAGRDVAEMCRIALLEFLNGQSWGKRDLVHWLLHRYRPLAAPMDAAVENSTGATASRGVHPIRLRRFVESARDTILDELLAARSSRDELEQRFLSAGLVVPCKDVNGETCYLPLDVPGLRLADRLRGLVLVDLLHGTTRYENLIVCKICDLADFDAETPPLGVCHACRRRSGVRVRSEVISEEFDSSFDTSNWVKVG